MICTLLSVILVPFSEFSIFTVERERGLQHDLAIVRSRSASDWLATKELLKVPLSGNRSVDKVFLLPNQVDSGILELHDYHQELVGGEYRLQWQTSKSLPFGHIGSFWQNQKNGKSKIHVSNSGWASWFEESANGSDSVLMVVLLSKGTPTALKRYPVVPPSRIVLCDNTERLLIDNGTAVHAFSLNPPRLRNVIPKPSSRADLATDSTLRNWLSWSRGWLVSIVNRRTISKIAAADLGNQVCKWGNGAVVEVKSRVIMGNGLNPNGTHLESVMSQLVYWNSKGRFEILDTARDTPGNLDTNYFILPASVPAECPLAYSVWSNRVRAIDPITHHVKSLFSSIDPVLQIAVSKN